jgi:hypothetical protein
MSDPIKRMLELEIQAVMENSGLALEVESHIRKAAFVAELAERLTTVWDKTQTETNGVDKRQALTEQYFGQLMSGMLARSNAGLANMPEMALRTARQMADMVLRE